jgi:hypothetical protein
MRHPSLTYTISAVIANLRNAVAAVWSDPVAVEGDGGVDAANGSPGVVRTSFMELQALWSAAQPGTCRLENRQ